MNERQRLLLPLGECKLNKGPIHLISLGAGVQSSTMALMAATGEITPMPLAAIFADTKAEPQSVYRWLDWLEPKLPFPVYRVAQGNGLEADTLRERIRKDGKGSWVPSGIPHYSLNADGTTGTGPRQCTHDFKLTPINREVRKILKEHGCKRATMWIGISLDEVYRMKPARVNYLTHIWPLIERKLKRYDCLRWMETHGFPKPPRSACVFCPYHSNEEWRHLKTNEPESFERAVQFERAYAAAKERTSGLVPFLHSSLVPLEEVDLSTDLDRGQLSLFGNECEGLCGV